MNHKLVNVVDSLVETGLYSSRSDAIRDAVRRLILESQIGSIPNTENSVKEIRKIRTKLSKVVKNFKDLQK